MDGGGRPVRVVMGGESCVVWCGWWWTVDGGGPVWVVGVAQCVLLHHKVVLPLTSTFVTKNTPNYIVFIFPQPTLLSKKILLFSRT